MKWYERISFRKTAKLMTDSKKSIDFDGTVFWHNQRKQKHNEHGPAVEHADGRKEWFLNDKRHRPDGPAIITANGKSEQWFIHGKRHRTDGPAVTITDNNVKSEYWYLDDKLHRMDGPAIDHGKHKSQSFWIHGKRHTKIEYNFWKAFHK